MNIKSKVSGATIDSRWILLSGLLFDAAWTVGLALVSSPAASASTADLFVREFYTYPGPPSV